jgi:hypothetical protein
MLLIGFRMRKNKIMKEAYEGSENSMEYIIKNIAFLIQNWNYENHLKLVCNL